MLLLARAPSFDGVFAVLKTPGVRLHVDSGYGRNTEDLTKIDPFRDNWWCSSGIAQEYLLYGPVLIPAPLPERALPVRRRPCTGRCGMAEAAIAPISLPTGWRPDAGLRSRHPQDPRIPEALYLLAAPPASAAPAAKPATCRIAP